MIEKLKELWRWLASLFPDQDDMSDDEWEGWQW